MPPKKAPTDPAKDMKLSSLIFLDANFLKLPSTEYPMTIKFNEIITLHKDSKNIKYKHKNYLENINFANLFVSFCSLKPLAILLNSSI